jgi:hypothetical protein
MRFYTQQHRFYCGIDLHARLLAVCIVDQAGSVVLRKQSNALDLWVAVTRLLVYEAALDLCRRLHPEVPRLPVGRCSSRSPPDH